MNAPLPQSATLAAIHAADLSPQSLAAIAAGCEREATLREGIAARQSPLMRFNLGTDDYVRTLRHIAADCRSAMDGCDASMASVVEWLDDEGDAFAHLAEPYVDRISPAVFGGYRA